MIEDAVWETGSITSVDVMSLSTMYTGERGTQTKICSSVGYNNCTDTVTRTTEWVGKVGLVYPSDYGYASLDESCATDLKGTDSTCENNNWLHPNSENGYWTISPVALYSNADMVWCVEEKYSMNGPNASYLRDVRPSVYLMSSVKLVGGTGDSKEGNNGVGPYRLSL